MYNRWKVISIGSGSTKSKQKMFHFWIWSIASKPQRLCLVWNLEVADDRERAHMKYTILHVAAHNLKRREYFSRYVL